jgi:Putative Actinobacterial Holin-X, holin superfamily III
MTMAKTEPPTIGTTEAADELLGQLAHELSVLMRCDIELSHSTQTAEQRHRQLELVAIAGGALAALLALGAATLALVQLLAMAVSDWAAAAIVAGVWAIVAALLLRFGDIQRLLRRLSGTDPAAVAAAQAEREAAERAIRSTARAFAAAAIAEATASLAHQAVESTEREAEALLVELRRVLMAPGRLGIDVLSRLVGGAHHDDGSNGID